MAASSYPSRSGVHASEGFTPDQVPCVDYASMFDGTNNYNPSRFRLYVPDLGYVQLPEYNRFAVRKGLSTEMPPVASGSEFLPPYAMDPGCAYYPDLPLHGFGIVSNTVTPVDD